MPRAARTPSSRPSLPPGSLTQLPAHQRRSCRACGSGRVTHLEMNLTDGSPVEFLSCHACEHRTWQAVGGEELSVDTVLDKARKRP